MSSPTWSLMNGLCGRRSEEHTSELQSHLNLVCRLLLEKKKIREKHPREPSLLHPPPQAASAPKVPPPSSVGYSCSAGLRCLRRSAHVPRQQPRRLTGPQ